MREEPLLEQDERVEILGRGCQVVMHDDHPIRAKDKEDGEEAQRKLKAFKQRASAGRVIHLEDSVRVKDLARQLGIRPAQVVASLLEFGCYVDHLETTISFSRSKRSLMSRTIIGEA